MITEYVPGLLPGFRSAHKLLVMPSLDPHVEFHSTAQPPASGNFSPSGPSLAAKRLSFSASLHQSTGSNTPTINCADPDSNSRPCCSRQRILSSQTSFAESSWARLQPYTLHHTLLENSSRVMTKGHLMRLRPLPSTTADTLCSGAA
jgi:hypothetical protein